ncbi:PilZ domain-containing protein [Sphingomonas ginsengisoli (ex An et al. 2013)]
MATLTTDLEQQLCLVLNIGAGGMKVRYFGNAPEGSAVTVSMRGDQKFHGHVSWRTGDLLGIRFNEKLNELVEGCAVLDSGARKRSPRLPVHFQAQIWCEGALTSVRVVNLSPSGAAVIISGKPPRLRQVALKVPGLASFPAQVRWSDGDRIGLSFNTPLLFTQLQRLVSLSSLNTRAAVRNAA